MAPAVHHLPGSRVNDAADGAAEVLSHLDLDVVDWVGNVWGGHVGIVFAARHPDRIKTLVTIGIPLTPLSGSERRKIVMMVRVFGLLGPVKPLRNAVIATLLTPSNRAKDKEAVRITQDAFTAGDRTAMVRALQSRMLDRPDLTDCFRAIRIPVLMMAGAEDPVWTPQQASLAAVGHSSATVVSIPNAAHLPPLEAPELTTRCILEFWGEIYLIGLLPHGTECFVNGWSELVARLMARCRSTAKLPIQLANRPL